MQFALIGDHPDGLAMARALLETGGYRLAVFAGPNQAAEPLRQSGFRFEVSSDVEEVLARPDLELVIVADDLEHRPPVLRRAVQSEKHVLCVHPADLLPDVAYEVAMIQQDTRKVLLPLLAERLSPGLIRLRQLYQEGVLGKLQMIECERGFSSLTSADKDWERSPLLSVWDSLRWLGGEIADISALASTPEDLQPGDQLTLTGRFIQGGLFQVVLLPGAQERCRVLLRGTAGEAELHWPDGLSGPAQLQCRAGGVAKVESWVACPPWPALSAVWEGTLARRPQPLTWLDETRCLELFDTARRSAKRGRVLPMVYEEFTESSTFKSLMTSLGCGLLLLTALLLILCLTVGIWLEWPRWVMYLVPIPLLLFMLLQLLRWIVPEEADGGSANRR